MQSVDGTQKPDQALIETITFLGGLVSQSKTAEPLLQRLHSIIADKGPNSTLSDDEREELYELRSQLEEHLIQRDTLRSFTPEALDQTVERHLETEEMGMSRSAVQLVSVLLLIPVAYVMGFFLMSGVNLNERFLLAAPFALLTLYIIIVWFYISGLKNFQQKPRQAFTWVSAGIFITGIGAAQGPVLLAFPSLTQVPFLAYNGSIFIFTLSCLAIYIGLRIFVRHIGIRSRLASLSLIVGGSAVIAAATPFLPHAAVTPNEWAYDLAIVSSLLCAFYSVLGAVFASQIAKQVTVFYAQAMTWFSATMSLVALNTVYVAIFIYFAGPISGTQLTFIAAPFSVSGILMFIAGYLFKKNSGNV